MKDETVAAASGLPFETWISRSLVRQCTATVLSRYVHSQNMCDENKHGSCSCVRRASDACTATTILPVERPKGLEHLRNASSFCIAPRRRACLCRCSCRRRTRHSERLCGPGCCFMWSAGCSVCGSCKRCATRCSTPSAPGELSVYHISCKAAGGFCRPWKRLVVVCHRNCDFVIEERISLPMCT